MEIEIVAETEAILKRFELLTLNSQKSKMELKVLSDTLPIFEPGGNLSIFIKEVDRLMRFADGKLDDGQKYLLGGIIRNKIRGEARNTIAFHGDENWAQMKAALLARYGDQRSEELLVTNLDQCVQNPVETYIEFYHAVVGAYHALLQNITLNVNDANTLEFKKNLYKEQAVKAFKMGIIQPYKSYLSHFELDTLEKCLVKCQAYDNMKSEWEYKESIRRTKFPQKQKQTPQPTNALKAPTRPFVPTPQRFNKFQQPFHQPHQQFRSGSGFTRNNNNQWQPKGWQHNQPRSQQDRPFPSNRMAIQHEPTPMSGVSVQPRDLNNIGASNAMAVPTANVGTAQSIDSAYAQSIDFAQGQAGSPYEQASPTDSGYYCDYDTYAYSQDNHVDTYYGPYPQSSEYESDFMDPASTEDPT